MNRFAIEFDGESLKQTFLAQAAMMIFDKDKEQKQDEVKVAFLEIIGDKMAV